MTEISFFLVELGFALLWIVIRIIVWVCRRRIDWKREALMLLMYVNLAVIIRFTFFPMETVDGKVQPLVFDPSAVFPFKINLIPFVNILYGTKSGVILNIVGNVAMFIPTGIVLPIVYPRLDRFWKVLLTGFLISLSIELLQLPFAVRTSDVDDLILNTLGVAIGYAIYALVRAAVNSSRKKRSGQMKHLKN